MRKGSIDHARLNTLVHNRHDPSVSFGSPRGMSRLVYSLSKVRVPVAELNRQAGAGGGAESAGGDHGETLYRWKKQYKGLKTDQVRQFKRLQEENGRLKLLGAELTREKTILQDVLAKKSDGLATPPGGELSARHLPGDRATCMP